MTLVTRGRAACMSSVTSGHVWGSSRYTNRGVRDGRILAYQSLRAPQRAVEPAEHRPPRPYLGAHERAWLAVDRRTVFLWSALDLLEDCAGRVRTEQGLSDTGRADVLSDLASVKDVIEGALQA